MATENTLEKFISNVKKHGLVKNTFFRVILPSDIAANKATFPGANIVSMNCESVNLPGMRFAMSDNRIFGEIREMPYMPTYANLELSFLVDNTMGVTQYFQTWLDTIIDPTSRTMQYYDNYRKDFNIQLMDRNDKILQDVTVFESYPIAVSDVPLNVGSTELFRYNVTMYFKYWRKTKSSTSPPVNNTSANTADTTVEEFIRAENTPGANLVSITDSISDLGFSDYNSFVGNITKFGETQGSNVLRYSDYLNTAIRSLSNNQPADVTNWSNYALELGSLVNSISGDMAQLGVNIDSTATPLTSVNANFTDIASVISLMNSSGVSFGVSSSLLAEISAGYSTLSSTYSGQISRDQMKELMNKHSSLITQLGSELQKLAPISYNYIPIDNMNEFASSLVSNASSLSTIANNINNY